MSRLAHLFFRTGNLLYRHAFPVYRPLYFFYKAVGDRHERRLIARLLRPGDVVVDIGANIGVYSKFLAQCVGENGEVHSFEPCEEHVAYLQETVAALPNVRVNASAVSDVPGEIPFFISHELNVDHRAYPAEGAPRQVLRVPATRLDDYFAPGTRVDLIKADVQGYELRVLRGAARVLAENVDIKLLLEFWPYGLRQAGDSAEALFTFLENQRLGAYVLRGDQLIRCEAEAANANDPDDYINIFVSRDRIPLRTP